jgi:hypothetical protein
MDERLDPSTPTTRVDRDPGSWRSGVSVKLFRVAGEVRAAPGPTVRGDGVDVLAIGAAILLASAAALAQLLDYAVFDLRIRVLDSNTHASIFGGVSLLATTAAFAAAVALAVRARDRERFALALVILVILALRVSHPTHVVFVSLPVTAAAFVILCRQFTASRSRMLQVGCSLLVLSLVFHALLIAAPAPLSFDRDSWAYQLASLVKHDAQLAGWILIAAGILSVRRLLPRQRPADRPAFETA